ncbi:DUF4099 domain-containing protein [Mucilaginibacter polytrichastri]|uniref:DUF4099 domain-containing protein n=1 Tax=Mucilaginibacter polytrichastri TaxID=1302689 RepID=A0A1Q6A478_9SPHI|nr:DUF4099 domain-containing protein [Mucilaginibacter polytrichastri]OKS88808.1 hypothetical protein RG47T_4286 [Mucilaginibacter polytrichastri]SFT05938.1 Protein of unknown function [Mucilaginibacter polytrichastri]
MNDQIFKEAELPFHDLGLVGLISGDRVLLEEADLKALLSGRRTQLIQLENLEFAGIKIASLKAKLSLVTGADGKPELLVHPTYLRSTAPTYLTEEESWALETGDELSLEKDIIDANGQKKRVLIEFDRETNQFLETDEEKVEAPDEINGYPLTPDQKAKYKRGQEVEVPDGTKVKYTATTREGIRANRIALIASIVFDGGITYLLFHGIKALIGQKHDAASTEQSQGYKDTVEQMKKAQEKEPAPELDLSGEENDRDYKRRSTR